MCKIGLISLATLLLLSSCSPKYQEGNMIVGGYTSNHLGERVYQVAYRPGLFFNEKGLSKKDLVILKRASELTVDKGFSHFTHTVNSLTQGITIHLYSQNDEDLPPQAISAEDFLAFND